MRSRSDSDKHGRDVVHDYVRRLPDDAAACLDIGRAEASGGWSEETSRIRAFVSSERRRSVRCSEVLAA